MKRRDFLKTGAMAVVGTAVAASGLAATTGADQALPKLTTLKPNEAQTLFKLSREIFPHPKVGDAPYWKVVGDLDAAAQKDPATAKMLADGVEQLDGRKFAQSDQAQRIEAIKAIENTDFFQKVRGVELQSLYSDPEVFKAFGYGGASYPMGGYLHHGFNDLDWLPEPPESASPKPA